MKLDRLKLAYLVAFITREVGSMPEYVINEVDNLIDIGVLEVPPLKASCADVDNLLMLMLMAEGTRKIEAIKAYRTLTGAGLKESKDAVEKYWNSKGHYNNPPETPTDILGHAAGRNKAGNDISGI
jgi:Ribosomal protein L7/L12 C-terminal domain